VYSRFDLRIIVSVGSYFVIDKFSVYHKGEDFQEQYHEFLGKGIFVSNGDQWKMHRQIASALFQTSELKRHTSVFKRQASTLINRVWVITRTHDGVSLEDCSHHLYVFLSTVEWPQELNRHARLFHEVSRDGRRLRKPIDQAPQIHLRLLLRDRLWRSGRDCKQVISFNDWLASGFKLNSINQDENRFQTAFDYVQFHTDQRANMGTS